MVEPSTPLYRNGTNDGRISVSRIDIDGVQEKIARMAAVAKDIIADLDAMTSAPAGDITAQMYLEQKSRADEAEAELARLQAILSEGNSHDQ